MAALPKYVNNPALKTIKPGWPGTPVNDYGRFMNYEHPYLPSFRNIFKWTLSRNPQKAEKQHDPFHLQYVNDTSFLDHNNDCIVWLGHATFFIRLNGINMLTDPVFYNLPVIKRYAQHAFTPELFHNLHYLLLSHDHRDHCEKRSIRTIVSQNPGITILTGLNMDKLLHAWSNHVAIQTAGWFQQYNTNPSINIYYLPAQHWARRGIGDTNKHLWGSFMIQAHNKTIFFGGDSAYDNHFQLIASLFPHITVAMLGVGAYKPAWVMQPVHTSPYEAVKAFNEMGARLLIPMHYGTFNISDEPPGEPLRILHTLEKDGAINGQLQALKLGEAFTSF